LLDEKVKIVVDVVGGIFALTITSRAYYLLEFTAL